MPQCAARQSDMGLEHARSYSSRSSWPRLPPANALMRAVEASACLPHAPLWILFQCAFNNPNTPSIPITGCLAATHGLAPDQAVQARGTDPAQIFEHRAFCCHCIALPPSSCLRFHPFGLVAMFRSKAIAQQPGMSNISSAIRDYHLGLLVHLSQPGTSWNRVQCSRAGVCLMPVIPSASFAASCCYWRFPCFLSSDRYLRLLTQLAYISLRLKFLAARVRKPYHRSHWPSSPPAVAL